MARMVLGKVEMTVEGGVGCEQVQLFLNTFFNF